METNRYNVTAVTYDLYLIINSLALIVPVSHSNNDLEYSFSNFYTLSSQFVKLD